MRIVYFLTLFVLTAIWGCQEKKEEKIIGEWRYGVGIRNFNKEPVELLCPIYVNAVRISEKDTLEGFSEFVYLGASRSLPPPKEIKVEWKFKDVCHKKYIPVNVPSEPTANRSWLFGININFEDGDCYLSYFFHDPNIDGVDFEMLEDGSDFGTRYQYYLKIKNGYIPKKPLLHFEN